MSDGNPEPSHRGVLRAELALVAAALAWGLSFVLVKGTLEVVPPHSLVALRFVLASAAVASVCGAALRRASARTWGAGLLLGGLLWAGFSLQTLGLAHTTPAKSAFLTACSVLAVPFLERLWLGSPLAPRVAAALAGALAGLALLLRPETAGLNPGDLWTLGCAAAFALHITALGRYAPGHPTGALAAIQMLAVAGLALLAALALEPRALALRPVDWAALGFLGLVCSAGAYGAQTWAQRRTSPTRTGLLLALEPVFAAGAAMAFWGERLGTRELLGGGLVVASVMLSQRERAPEWSKR